MSSAGCRCTRLGDVVSWELVSAWLLQRAYCGGRICRSYREPCWRVVDAGGERPAGVKGAARALESRGSSGVQLCGGSTSCTIATYLLLLRLQRAAIARRTDRQ